MKAVLQVASGASVTVDEHVVAAFEGVGIVALIGVHRDDELDDAQWVARKIADLRILPHEQSVTDAGAAVIVVSQFTLYADVKKGRRPSWNAAAPPDVAAPLIEAVVEELHARGVATQKGVFGAHMRVSLTNDGPVTILLDSHHR
jgi:D-tyrosyl-tRNA(Tyr) deacylase